MRSHAFWKALLIAFVIEAVVLALTLEPLLRSGMAHTASHPDSLSNTNPLVGIAIGFSVLFHLPSLVLAGLLGAPVLAPVFQIVMLTGLVYMLMPTRKGEK